MASDIIKYLKTNLNNAQMDLVKWESELKLKVRKNDYKGTIHCVRRFIEFMVIYVNNKDLKQQISVSRQSFKLIKDIVQDKWKNVFIKDIIQVIFDIIIEESGECWCLKKELLRIFNNWVQKTNNLIVHDAAKSLSKMYLFKLVDSINSYGDYDLQVTIIEAIFRTYGKSEINTRLQELIPESAQLSQTFSEITPQNFDEDCRIFLNAINEKSEKIFSIICASVIIDGIFCQPPMDNIGGLWLDFNLCDKIISWYRSRTVSSDDIWELLTLFSSELEEVSIESKPDSYICIHFKLSGQLISSEDDYQESLNQAKTVTILVENSDKAEELVKDVLPKVLGDLVYKTTPKSSQKCSTGRKYYDALNIKISKVANKSLISVTKSDISSAYNMVDPLKLTSKSSSASKGPSTYNVEDSIRSQDQNESIQIIAGRSSDSAVNYSKITNSQNNNSNYKSAQAFSSPYFKASKSQDINSSSDVWETAKQNLLTEDNSRFDYQSLQVNTGHNSSEISSLGECAKKIVSTNKKFDISKKNKLTKNKDTVYNKTSKIKTKEELKVNTGINNSQDCSLIEDTLPKNSSKDNKVSKNKVTKIQTKEQLKSIEESSKCDYLSLKVNIEKIPETNYKKTEEKLKSSELLKVNTGIKNLQGCDLASKIEEIIPKNSSKDNKVSKNKISKIQTKEKLKSTESSSKCDYLSLEVNIEKIQERNYEKTKEELNLHDSNLESKINEKVEETVAENSSKNKVSKIQTKDKLKPTGGSSKYKKKQEKNDEKTKSIVVLQDKQESENKVSKVTTKLRTNSPILDSLKTGIGKIQFDQKISSPSNSWDETENNKSKYFSYKVSKFSEVIIISDDEKENVKEPHTVKPIKDIIPKKNENSLQLLKKSKGVILSDRLDVMEKVSKISLEEENTTEKQLDHSNTAIAIKENIESNLIEKSKSKEIILSGQINLINKVSKCSQEEEIMTEKQLDHLNTEVKENNQIEAIKDNIESNLIEKSKYKEFILSDQIHIMKKVSKYSQKEEIITEKQLDYLNTEVKENNQIETHLIAAKENDANMMEKSITNKSKDELNVTKKVLKFSQVIIKKASIKEPKMAKEITTEKQLDHSDAEVEGNDQIEVIKENVESNMMEKSKSKKIILADQINVMNKVSKCSQEEEIITEKQLDNEVKENNQIEARLITAKENNANTIEKSITNKSKDELNVTKKLLKFSQVIIKKASIKEPKMAKEITTEKQLNHSDAVVEENNEIKAIKENFESNMMEKSKSKEITLSDQINVIKKVSKCSQEEEIIIEKQLNHSNAVVEENYQIEAIKENIESNMMEKSKSKELILPDQINIMKKVSKYSQEEEIITEKQLDHLNTEIKKNNQIEAHLITAKENDANAMGKRVTRKSKYQLNVTKRKISQAIINKESIKEPKEITTEKQLDHSNSGVIENDKNDTNLIATKEKTESNMMIKSVKRKDQLNVTKKVSQDILIKENEEPNIVKEISIEKQMNHSNIEVKENNQNDVINDANTMEKSVKSKSKDKLNVKKKVSKKTSIEENKELKIVKEITTDKQLDHSNSGVKENQNEAHLIATKENDELNMMEENVKIKSAKVIKFLEQLDHSNSGVEENDQNDEMIKRIKLDYSNTEIRRNDQIETNLIATEDKDESKLMEEIVKPSIKIKSAKLQEKLDHSNTKINKNEAHLIPTKEKSDFLEKIAITNKEEVIDVDEKQQDRYPKRRTSLINKNLIAKKEHKDINKNKQQQRYPTRKASKINKESTIKYEQKKLNKESKQQHLKKDIIVELSKVASKITVNEQNEEPESYKKNICISTKKSEINEEPENCEKELIEKPEINIQETNKEPGKTEINEKSQVIQPKELEIKVLIIQPKELELSTSSEEEIQPKLNNKKMIIQDTPEDDVTIYEVLTQENTPKGPKIISKEENSFVCDILTQENTPKESKIVSEENGLLYETISQENNPKESKIVSEENGFVYETISQENNKIISGENSFVHEENTSKDKISKSKQFSSPIDPDKAFDLLLKETIGNLNKVKDLRTEMNNEQFVYDINTVEDKRKSVQFDLKSNQTMSSGKRRRSRKLYNPNDLSIIIRDETETEINKNELESINKTIIESLNENNISDIKKPYKTKKTKRKNFNETPLTDLIEEQKLIDKKQKIYLKNNINTSSHNSKKRGLSNLNFLQNSWRNTNISINFNGYTTDSKKRKTFNSTPKKNKHKSINNRTIDISEIEKPTVTKNPVNTSYEDKEIKLSRKRNKKEPIEIFDTFITRKRAKKEKKRVENEEIESIKAEETTNRLEETSNVERLHEIVQVENNKILIHSNIRLNSFDPDPPKRRNIQENEQISTRLVGEESRECNLTTNSNYEGFIGTMAPYWTVNAFFEDKIVTLNSNDYIGKYLVIVFYPLDFATLPYANPPVEILSINEKYEAFQELNTNVLGCSVDSIFTHDAWLNCHCNEYNFSKENLKFPLLADTNHVISKAFMVYSKTQGHSYRAYYIISPTGIIVGCSMNQINCPIAIDEILFQIKCNQGLYS